MQLTGKKDGAKPSPLDIKGAEDELDTIRDFIRWTVSSGYEHNIFLGHGYDDLWDEAVMLVLHALHLPWDIDARVQECRVTDREKEQILTLVQKRIVERIPTAYLIGRAWFAGLEFKVDDRVLIPRSPIGELIEKQFEPWIAAERVESILDLCTGSGCIGIACAHHFPDVIVDCVDISEAALDIAEENLQNLGLESQVNLIFSDLFEALDGRTYDIIVSNPPYVDERDMAELPTEYRHEPELGLEAGGDGLDIVRRILPELSRHLNPEGIAVIEVGNSMEALEQAYPHVPFTWIEFENSDGGVFILTKEEIDHYQRHFVE
ncbi:Adenine-specific methylase [gamma proteobacterium HdN1]|nr:Adenine-specific methylase [gamma proteobacterium HdN1]